MTNHKGLFKFFISIVALTTLIHAAPCGTNGTPRRPTPSPKNNPNNGTTSRPSTPRPSK